MKGIKKNLLLNGRQRGWRRRALLRDGRGEVTARRRRAFARGLVNEAMEVDMVWGKEHLRVRRVELAERHEARQLGEGRRRVGGGRLRREAVAREEHVHEQAALVRRRRQIFR